MKSFLYSMVFFVIILVFITLTSVYVHKSSAALVEALDEIGEAVSREDWAVARELSAAMEQQLEKTRTNYSMVIDHIELDAITIAFKRMNNYINMQHRADSEAELAALRFMLSHLPKKDMPQWENIL